MKKMYGYLMFSSPTAMMMLVLLAVSPLQTALALEASCVSEPSRDATLSLPVSGRVNKIYFSEGDRVKRGALLLSLESQLERLEAERRKLVWKSRAELEAAGAQEATYKLLLESTRALYVSTKSVSRDELDKMKLEYAKAVAERKRLEVAEQREAIEYRLARAQLDQRDLKAPYAGTIVEMHLQEGESADPNQPLVQLVDTRRAVLVCNVEEPAGRRTSKGQSVSVRLQTGSGYWNGKGEVIFASPVVDAASGLMRIKVRFDNKDGTVRPGVPGYVTLVPDS